MEIRPERLDDHEAVLDVHRQAFVTTGRWWPAWPRRCAPPPSLRIPDAAFQVKTLSAYEPWMTGTFVYAQVFWDHDCVGLR